MITKAESVMKDFMIKLKNDEFQKETFPDNDNNNAAQMNSTFVEEQINSYIKLLQLKSINNFMRR